MIASSLLTETRRHFFERCGIGLGSMALAALLGEGRRSAASTPEVNPLASRPGHFPARAKRVIYLFMAGGPSQLELFDYKPKLQEYHGEPIPDSFVAGRRFAFMDQFTKERPKLLGTARKFARHGQSGAWVSELLPRFAEVVDEVAVVRSVATDVFNHAPAKLFVNTGTTQFGRPSMGSWITYGIGSESNDLPGFVVLQSGPRGPRGGAVLWSSGFLPSAYQGVPLRSGGEPILNLSSPKGINPARQRRAIEAIGDLNRDRLGATGDPEIAARISSYEMAYRMQSSAPDLIDLAGESAETLRLYGAEPGASSFANNCLLARRLVERGARFVQLYHTEWDHHGGPGQTLNKDLDHVCREIDQPCAALVLDLKRRGLLDDTLVVWGGEFGRTPMGEVRESVGRNHHIDSATMWLAGGGIKPGLNLGATDEFGFAAIEDRVHVHDLQATILHLLGLDHTRLTYRFQGRDVRLTDVAGNVVTELAGVRRIHPGERDVASSLAEDRISMRLQSLLTPAWWRNWLRRDSTRTYWRVRLQLERDWLRSLWAPPDFETSEGFQREDRWVRNYDPVRDDDAYELTLEYAEKRYEEASKLCETLDKKLDDIVRTSATIGTIMATVARVVGIDTPIGSSPLMIPSIFCFVVSVYFGTWSRGPTVYRTPMPIRDLLEAVDLQMTVSKSKIMAPITASYHAATLGTNMTNEWKSIQLRRSTIFFCTGLLLLVLMLFTTPAGPLSPSSASPLKMKNFGVPSRTGSPS